MKTNTQPKLQPQIVMPRRAQQILTRLREYRETEFQRTSEAYRRIVNSLGE